MVTRFFSTIYCTKAAEGAHQMICTNIDGSRNHQNDTGPIDIVEETALAHVEDVVGSSNSGFESEINEIKELVDYLSREEDDIKGELQWLESRTGKKRKRITQVDDWLARTTDLKGRALEMIRLLGQGWSTGHSTPDVEIKELIEDAQALSERKPLVLSNESVLGHSFYLNIDMLWELIRDDKVLIIGIHGMGGVGKTTLVTHFKNQITRDRAFKHVIWVTVSQDFSIFKLQTGIAKRIGIKLDEDDEIITRAEFLSSALDKKDKLVLILDDVWNHIDLQKVGIPLRVNRIKLIITSRLEHVFQQMDCPLDNILRMEPLCSEDAWELFLLKLGCYGTPATLPHEVEKIARSLVKKCNGLPLGISVMARTMKGVNDIRLWRDALSRLGNSATGEEMGEDVFKVLKLSYDHLMDKNIRNCFLHSTLYNHISAEEFITNLLDEGLIKGMGSLEEIFDTGHAILDKLKGQSLLLEAKDNMFHDCFRMHDLVRDMACHILKDRYMVKCQKGLTTMPDMQEWAPHLEKVTLRYNYIEKISEGTSPRCPRLSTLIFSRNGLKHIPDCFFKHMKALTVLDLSYNHQLIALPYSLSRLRSLKSLLLDGCYSLKYVPPLEKLQELSRLVISDTSIQQVPEGLAMLVKLKWLDLSWNEKLRLAPGSVLPNLIKMQYLDLRGTNVKVVVEDLQAMSMLECFAGSFQDCKNLDGYVQNILDNRGPKYYHLSGTQSEDSCDCQLDWGYRKTFSKDNQPDRQGVHFGDCQEFHHQLPRDLHLLCILDNKQWSGRLCDVVSFKASSSLRRIQIEDCPKLERLFCLSNSCSLCKYLQNLQVLKLDNLESLDVIWKENDEGICLPNLSHLNIIRCHRMENLLTPVSLLQLPSLETIEVYDCNSLKEIFAIRSGEDDNIDSAITLPKSLKMKLWLLPQLKTVCTRIIISGSRPTVDVFGCPNLTKGSLRYKSSDFDSESVVLL